MSQQPSVGPGPLTSAQKESLDQLRLQLQGLHDPRCQGKVRYPLGEVLMIALCSIMSDNDDFTDMGAFASSQRDWLGTFLPMKHGAPSHDVFRNVFMALKPSALLGFLPTLCGHLLGKQICVDGKALRGTYDKFSMTCGVYVLRAWVREVGLSFGHVNCTEKGNERTALPELLASIELTGALVTIDAMGCHPAAARQIVEDNGDYLLCLKANEASTFAEVSAHFPPEEVPALTEITEETPRIKVVPTETLGPPLAVSEFYETVELSHGRFERRKYTVITDLSFMKKGWKWWGLKTVIKVDRWSHRHGTKEALGHEVHYYLCSRTATAEKFAQWIRGHWSVENQCHWVLDVTYGEDHCQVRDKNAAHNRSILREITAKAIKDHLPKKSIRSKRKLAAMCLNFRTALLASILQVFHV
jgi:predicted transposase YbfD/YdcC